MKKLFNHTKRPVSDWEENDYDWDSVDDAGDGEYYAEGEEGYAEDGEYYAEGEEGFAEDGE